MSTASTLDSDVKMTTAKALRAAREAREARVKFWRVFAVSSFFAVVLGANLFVGAVVLVGNLRGAPADDEPDVGDGRVAQTIEDKVERCDHRAKKGTKRKSEFSWGGR
jgi:hypothetical protein